MQALRKLLGIPDRYAGLSVLLLLSLLFVLMFAILRGCIGARTLSYDPVNIVPSANTPIVRSDLEDANVLFTGTAGANQTVFVYVDGELLGSTESDRIGQWFFEGLVEDEGRHTLELRATQADGSLVPSGSLPFELDFRAATDGQSLAGPGSSVDYLVNLGDGLDAADAEIVPPTISTVLDGRTVPDGTFTVRGTGTPGRDLLVFSGVAAFGLVRIDDSGNWSIDTELAPGTTYTFRAEDSLLDDLETEQFTVNTGLGIARPTLSIERDGRSAILPLVGTGEPNTTLNITQNGEFIGTVDVDGAGNWTLDVDRVADISDYTFVAEATDADGALLAASLPDSIRFESIAAEADVDDAPEPEPISAEVGFISPEFTLADISFANGVASGPLPLAGPAAPAGSRVLLFFDGQPLGETTVTDASDWALNADLADLAPGTYEVVAQIVDDAGSELASDTALIVIPEAPATAVTLALPALDLANITIDDDGLAGGTLPVGGPAEPIGETVLLYFEGELIGEAVIDEDGMWVVPFDWSLAPGTYTFDAEIVNDAGEVLAMDSAELVIPDIETTLQVVYTPSDNAAARLLEDAPVVELIFDASWSMTLPPESDAEADRLTADDPNSRIAIARDSVIEVIETLPEGVPIALRAFGNNTEPLGCQTELLRPLQPLDRSDMTATIGVIEPSFNANTHIAASLLQVPNDLAEAEGAITVVLLTDGQETCGGNVAGAIQSLRNQGIEVVVDVVGFAVNTDNLRAQFESWADIGGGDYYEASDTDGLATALELAFRPKYRVLDADGTVLAVGAVGSDKITLPAGNYTVEMLTSGGETYDVTVGPFATVLQVD